jgi:hypothetical protein
MKKMLGTILLASAVLPGVVQADEGPSVRFSGFGTLDAVRVNRDDIKFKSNPRQTQGAGRGWDLGVDSNLGVQANAVLNDTFSAVGQVLASRREGSEEPVLEWLYGQAKVTSWLDVRVGRLVLPVFLLSDSRSVGYSTHWVRAPVDVYANFPFSSFDGAQVDTRYALGGGNLSVQLSAGRSKGTIYTNLPFPMESVQIHMPKVRSMNAVYERGDWTMRFGRTVANKSYLRLEALGVDVPNADAFNSAGVQHDDGKLLVMAEYATRRQGDHGGDCDMAYLSAGYRFGPVMPFATISRFKPKGPLYPGQPSTNSHAFGARWDAFTNVALKAQYDRMDNWTVLQAPLSAFNAETRLHVLTLSADFVF